VVSISDINAQFLLLFILSGISILKFSDHLHFISGSAKRQQLHCHFT